MLIGLLLMVFNLMIRDSQLMINAQERLLALVYGLVIVDIVAVLTDVNAITSL